MSGSPRTAIEQAFDDAAMSGDFDAVEAGAFRRLREVVLAATPGESRTLVEAAKAVIDKAEPDDDFDGHFVEYLVPFQAIDALRAALAEVPVIPDELGARDGA